MGCCNNSKKATVLGNVTSIANNSIRQPVAKSQVSLKPRHIRRGLLPRAVHYSVEAAHVNGADFAKLGVKLLDISPICVTFRRFVCTF